MTHRSLKSSLRTVRSVKSPSRAQADARDSRERTCSASWHGVSSFKAVEACLVVVVGPVALLLQFTEQRQCCDERRVAVGDVDQGSVPAFAPRLGRSHPPAVAADRTSGLEGRTRCTATISPPWPSPAPPRRVRAAPSWYSIQIHSAASRRDVSTQRERLPRRLHALLPLPRRLRCRRRLDPPPRSHPPRHRRSRLGGPEPHAAASLWILSRQDAPRASEPIRRPRHGLPSPWLRPRACYGWWQRLPTASPPIGQLDHGGEAHDAVVGESQRNATSAR